MRDAPAAGRDLGPGAGAGGAEEPAATRAASRSLAFLLLAVVPLSVAMVASGWVRALAVLAGVAVLAAAGGLLVRAARRA